MNVKTIFGPLVFAISIAFTANAQSLGIGAGNQGSQSYAVNAALAKLLTDELGYDVRLQSYGGAGQSMPLIDAGRLDLQLITGPDLSTAVLGQQAFEGRQLNNLRAIAAVSSSGYGFMVRKDSELTKVSDIRGKKITYGYAAQPTLTLQVDASLAAAGLSIEDMQVVNVPSVPNGVDELIAGNVDAAYFALQGGKTREADAAVGIRWLALDQTPEAEAAMQEIVPAAYIKIIEPGTAAGVDEPTPMMAYDYVLTAGAHVSDDVISSILGLLNEKPDLVRALSRTYADFDPEGMARAPKGVVFHPAAVLYFEAHGLSKQK